MNRTVVALSVLMVLGWAPIAAQGHQHAAPPAPKPSAAKSAMSERIAEMNRKLTDG